MFEKPELTFEVDDGAFKVLKGWDMWEPTGTWSPKKAIPVSFKFVSSHDDKTYRGSVTLRTKDSCFVFDVLRTYLKDGKQLQEKIGKNGAWQQV